MKFRLKETSTLRHLIDFQKCLERQGLLENALVGWGMAFGTHCWHTGIRQHTVLNVLPPKKIGLQRKVALSTLGAQSLYTSMPFAAQLGRSVSVDEVFTQTHIRKGTDAYVDERSRKTIEDFSTRFTHAREDVGGAPDEASRTNAYEDIIKTQCWVDVVRGKKKGRIYGAGQLASHYIAARGGVLKHQPSSSNTTDQHNMVSREAYDELRSRLQTFEDILRKYIPEAGQILDPSSSHQAPTQLMQPTNKQSPNQHEPLVQQQQEDEEEHDSDDFSGY
ncbi:uncharacterized protein LOC111242297 isoform X2 [Vigna radiata var. radiata]|uniref:Uncharacterized protein LOC111242297 isoform X2 n=1 Tax=Vigna radiata var. radiata TaxID=3916 RepID=A0A3Q0FE00_VIGRR|nr:uncharacterized protein LOC111242297 isoform X2 [Vigna radiata var. radiata]